MFTPKSFGNRPVLRFCLLSASCITVYSGNLSAQTRSIKSATHEQRVTTGSVPVYAYDADSSQRSIVLPQAYRTALDSVAPGFLAYTRANAYDEGPDLFGVIGDVSNDRLPDVALAGTTPNNVLAVVLLYTSTGVVKGMILRGAPESASSDESLRSPDGRAKTSNRLSLEKARGSSWFRWQDSDCKGSGWQWTVKRGVVVRMSSPCSYGE